MIFDIKHTDVQNHRRMARVTGSTRDDCIAQVEAALGEHIGLAAIRVSLPALNMRHACPPFSEGMRHA